jgi:hypothetical protein
MPHLRLHVGIGCGARVAVFPSGRFVHDWVWNRIPYKHATNLGTVCRMAFTASTPVPQPSVADVGTRLPVQLAGWDVQGVSVAGQVSLQPVLIYFFSSGCPPRASALP